MKERLLIFLRGLFMGMADIIPGVSGGTIALITGIYERFIFALGSLSPAFLKHILKGDMKKAKASFMKMELRFLITLFAGIITSFLLLSGVIEFFMDTQPSNTYAFFFGLILASAGFVYRYVGKISARNITAGAAGFIFAMLFVGLGTVQSTHSLPVVFFSGIIAICAMLLPGISGAFILFFLGQYEYMLGALHGIEITIIAVFIAGAVTGLLSMSRVLSHLLKNHKPVTMSFLLGLMLGALRMPYENVISNEFTPLLVIISGATGFVSVIMLEKFAGNLDR